MSPEKDPRKIASPKSSISRSSPKPTRSPESTKSLSLLKPPDPQGSGRALRAKRGRSSKHSDHTEERLRSSGPSSASPQSTRISSAPQGQKQGFTVGERSTTSIDRRHMTPVSGTYCPSSRSLASVGWKASITGKLLTPVIGAIVLGAVLFVFVRLVRWRKPSGLHAPACGSHSCQQFRELLEEAIDENSQPCDDYYAHVCSLWTKSHERSVQRVTLEHFFNNAVKRLKTLPPIENVVTRKGTMFFSSCLSVANVSNVPGVKKLLAEGGIMWPSKNTNPDFLNALFYMSQRLFEPVFLRFTTENGGSTLAVRQSNEFLKNLRTLRRHIKTRHLHEHLSVTYEAFDAHDETRLKEIVDRFDHMEEFLDMYFNASWPAHSPSMTFTTYDTESFLRQTPSVSRDRWDSMLSRYFGASVAGLRNAVVENVQHFQALFRLHEDGGEAALNDVVEALCVQNLVRFTSFGIIASFHESSEVAAMWLQEKCFISTFSFFGYDLNHNFLASHRGALDNVERLAENVRQAFFDVLSDSENATAHSHRSHHEWRENISEHHFRKLFAVLKRSKARAYPAEYAVYPDLTRDPLQNWKILNEFYRRLPVSANSALIAFGENDLSKFRGFELSIQHLSFPYYEPDAHRGCVLGGLGTRLAAAVFYDYVDSQADFLKFYQRNHDCLAPDAGGEPDVNLQGAVAAIPVMFYMFRKASEDDEDASVKDLSHFRADRISFMFGCYLLCGEDNGETMCNVPLKHSADFARTYGCPVGSPMNPSEKCAMVP
ncbi:uncharacterized protein [Dermacentor albipictus]|uniref:uncharacterized protein n=1 Tax=Dermacentor albipictus TaxID=60249 RepID=UPI0031FE3B72